MKKTYVDSYKDGHHDIHVFSDMEKALDFLATEEYDFRTREIITKKEAEKLIGRNELKEITEEMLDL